MHDAGHAPSDEVETYPRHGLWHNRLLASDGGFLGTHTTRDEAVAAGRDEARWRRVPHLIRELDGSTQRRILDDA